MLALPIFLYGNNHLVHAISDSPVDCHRQKKPLTFVGGFYVGITYLPGQAKDCPAVRDSPVDCHRQKKAPTFQSRLCVGITYLPGQSPAKYCRRT